MAISGNDLRVTVLHAAAADLLWQNRHSLAAVFGCSTLRLTVLKPRTTDGHAIDIEWQRPPGAGPLVSGWKR